MVTCLKGPPNPEYQPYCGECGAPLIAPAHTGGAPTVSFQKVPNPSRRELAEHGTVPEPILVRLHASRHSYFPIRCSAVGVDRSRWHRRGGSCRTGCLYGSPSRR